VNILNSRAVSDDDITESDAKALRYLYDRVVEDIDSYLATLIHNIRNTLDRRTILLVVGDHGEEFGEHGKFTHSNRPYEELIHVPLLVVDGTDRCIDTLTSSIGIKPAISRLIAGENYLPPLRTDPVCRYIGGNSVPERTKRALSGFEDVSAVHTKISDGIKCTYDGTFETYDLKTDPGETHNVTQFDEHSDLMRATIQERAVERQQIMDQQILTDTSQEER
jgi:arylsulfatase A-like enzyme